MCIRDRFKEPSIGLQLATELGTIALLANIFREMMALDVYKRQCMCFMH